MNLVRRTVIAAALAAAFAAPAAAQHTLVMAMTATPKGFDPDIWVPGQIESTVNVYEGLTRFAARGGDGKPSLDFARIEPHFAEKWTVSPDGKTYTFKLRQGVKSPYGNQLSAADVVWTYEKSQWQKRTGLFMKNVGRVQIPQEAFHAILKVE